METDARDKYILCVGLCVLDIIHECKSYPEEDSDRRSMYGRWQRGGNASNICTVLRQLGDKCEFIGTISKSKMSQIMVDDCKDRDIRIANCVYHENCETPLSSVVLSEETGSRTIVHSNPNLPILTFDDFRKICFNHYKWIHFEARNLDETMKMIDFIVLWNGSETKHSITISVELENLSKKNIQLVKNADVIFLSKDYACLMGWTNKEVAIHNLRKYVKKDAKLICPWGAEGAVAIDNEIDSFYAAQAQPPVKVVDSLGAGDTFVASTIHYMADGKSLQNAIEFGCRIAGAKVGFHGYDGISDLINKKN